MSASAPRSPPRLLAIDALRGIAATMVMLYHLYNAASPHRELSVPSLVHEMFQLGEGGVQVFFVLSGFVIASNLEAIARLTPVVIARFMVRRSMRLDPSYWLLIALNALFLVVASSTQKADALSAPLVAANMLYVNGLFDGMFIVPVGWTLAFEVQLYLALAVALALARVAGRAIGADAGRALVFAPLLVWSVVSAASHHPVRASATALPAWHMFFLGVAAWWIVDGARGARATLVVAVGASVAVFVAAREAVTLLAPATALAIAIAARRGALTRPLGGRALQWLGALSYSLYLVHPLIGNKLVRFSVARLPDDLSWGVEQALRWMLVLAASAVSVGAAWLLWRLVERPAQRWARTFPVEAAR